ncbi:MAG TPA: hypothetical protein VMP08_04135, partial [Anaerolineae bacterium]|nr:hypothetical protein [Anaerolineae bacterium]
MTTQNTTTTIDSRANACETSSAFGWGWPDEAVLIDLTEQDVRAAPADRAEMAHRLEQVEHPSKN